MTTDPREQAAMEQWLRQRGKKQTEEHQRHVSPCPESQVNHVVEQIKNYEKLAKQSHDSITQTLRATLSTINNDNKMRFTRVEVQIGENTRQVDANTNIPEAMQTRIDARESTKSSSSSGAHKRNDRNSVRAGATGFTELS